MRLNKKIAIVTGSGSGLGKAIAMRLVSEGAVVIIADINQESITATVDEIISAGGEAYGCKVDIMKRDEIRKLMDDTIERLGRIDILVNNAGITRYRPFDSLADEDWNAVLDLDLKGVFYCAQAVAPHMVRQRYGKILNISSSLGTGASPHAAGGSPGGSAAYAAAKAGVIQLTRTLARELGPSSINVNCVAPGFFLTPLTGATRTPEEVKEHIAVRTEMAVLKRPGKLEELANVVLFLVSDEASFIAGQTLCVDGGRTDRM